MVILDGTLVLMVAAFVGVRSFGDVVHVSRACVARALRLGFPQPGAPTDRAIVRSREADHDLRR